MDLMDIDPVTETALFKPLGDTEFRVLLLQPAPPTAPLFVNLVSTSIADPPEYDGISYVWGDSKDVRSIWCNGISVDITASLHWALMRIRLLDRPRLVWADALCINQNDTQERSRQVTLMGYIYANTRSVFACMGDEAQGDQHMLHIWNKMSGDVDRIERWNHLGNLMRRAWFRRAWVLQEVGLAKNPRVVYGAVEFSYRAMMALVRWVQTYARHFAASMNIGGLLIHTQWANWIDWALNPSHQLYKLVDLLDHGALLNCRDPRDHIYAFLGHPLASRGCGGALIVPDYAKSVLQVYREATISLLQDAGIRILSSVEHSKVTIHEDYPSWVIRWNTGFVLNNIYTHPNPLYRAGHTVQAGVSRIVRNRLLARGVIFDIVDSVYIIRISEGSIHIEFAPLNGTENWSLLDLIRFLEDRTTSAYQHLRALYLACTLACYASVDDAPSTLLSSWSSYVLWLRRNCTNEISPQARALYIRLVANCAGRAFIVTRNGYYGLAPHIASPGDQCCILQGSGVPFLLRQMLMNESQELRLVGECLIQGVMRGEVVEMVRANKIQEDTISIR
ncbi:hypothetical protein F5Y19DRAFT_468714 [Xylariaceae sp. FL1651]|nr:hypothetical protein F5Y19DRAFT_468714 [Xylariaceae sp. FL1651]